MSQANKSPKKKRGISRVTIPIICVLVAITVALNAAANSTLSGILDAYIGRGEMKIETKAGAENWDTTYYDQDSTNAEDADRVAKDITLRTAEEGITLLKNEGSTLPLNTAAEKNVTLLGRRSVQTVFGGTGSGAGDTNQCVGIADALTAAGFQVNPTVLAMYQNSLDKVPVADPASAMDKAEKQTYYIGEFPQSYFTDEIVSSYTNYRDAAIVVFGRQGGEGMDFSTDLLADVNNPDQAMSSSVAETANYREGQHQLELNQEERDLLAHAEANFEKVIVVINSANVMEIGCLRDDPQVDAILWIAYPGSRGCAALASILSGTVNPSGHTVDTWAVDFTADPVFPNTSARKYRNVSKDNALADSYVLQYEEGIFFGYRWYETVFADGGTFTVEGQSGKSYEEAVAYPFGYGLSYTTFEQKIKDHKVENGQIRLTVSVSNTGSMAGKDVIQVYYHAPYTKGGIEKSAVNLAAFEKTELLQPGASADYTLSFPVEDMASYDDLVEKCYVLDEGEYRITVNRNVHEVYGEDCEFTHKVDKKVVYSAGNPRQSEIDAQKGETRNLSQEAKNKLTVVAATNQFEDMNAQFVSYDKSEAGKAVRFTRQDFAASFPAAPTDADLTASEATIQVLGEYKPDYYTQGEQAPTTGAEQTWTAVALRGATYDDPRWDMLLDQMTAKSMSKLIYAGNQGVPAVKNVGLPASGATDGPAGLKQYGGLGFGTSGNFHCSSVLTAATWNVKLAEEFGRSVGNEAMLAGSNMTGWYAPGCDIHRGPFGGRSFEYYSEDPLISGRICAATVKGAASMGLTCYAKHFVLNDMDRHRIDNGPVTWCNEQALREIYARAYEILVKEPTMDIEYLDNGETKYKTIRACTALMSSFNRIGDKWCGASSALLKTVLRDEWGFLGTVITDYNGNKYMHVEDGVNNGNDLMLANEMTLPTKFADTKNPSTIRIMREATKNILYTQVNSATVNNTSDATVITYGTAPWRAWVNYANIGLGVLIAGLLILTLLKRPRQNNITVENTAN